MKISTFLLFVSLTLFYTNSFAQTLEEIEAELNFLFEKGDYEKALPLAQKKVEIAGRISKDTTYAFFLNNYAELLFYLGRYEEAVTTFENCKSLRKKLVGTNHEDYATSLNNLGLTLATMGKYKDAEPLYKEALKIWKTIYGSTNYKVAAGLNNLALLYESMGLVKAAEPYYKEALQIMEKTKGKENTEYANTLSNLASVYETMGRFDEAEPHYRTVLQLKKKIHGTMHPQYAKSLNNLAFLYYNTAEYDEAEPLYKEALSVIGKSLGKEHIAYAITLNGLAALYQETERYLESLTLYLETKEIRKKALGISHPSYATSINNVATVYKILERYDKAALMYQEAMTILANKFGKEHPQYAKSLRNLGIVLFQLNNYSEAKAHFLEAQRILTKVHSVKHPEVIFTTAYLGDICLAMNQMDEARAFLDEAILHNVGLKNLPNNIDEAWKSKLLSKEPVSYFHLLDNLYYLYKLQRTHYEHTHDAKQLFEAKMLTRTALELAERCRRQFVSENDKLLVLEQSVAWAYKAIQNSIEIAEQEKLEEFHNKAFQYAEQSKSVLLAEAVQSDKAHVFGDLPDSLFDYEKELQEEQAAIRAALIEETNEGQKNNLRASLNVLNQKIMEFQERISRDYPKYNALKYTQSHISTSHIQELLDEETAMIEYVVADTVIYIFSVDKTHFDLYHISCTKDSLSNQIKRLRKALSDYTFIHKNPKKAFQLYTQTAHWFYKMLLEPAIHHEEIKHLLIIPDGELGHLPFEAFLSEPSLSQQVDYKTLHYLLKDFKISYDFSASLWDENESDYDKSQRGKHYESVLACAASYAPPKDSFEQVFRPAHLVKLRAALRELPAAKAEVEGLANEFEGAFLFDNKSSERFFKEHASEYGVIHLAMHGLLNINHPVLSSLAFSEDLDSVEDNFLCAYEIAHLHLNAQLVVLSACETGYGKFEKGEGVISLARAFMYAGVPSLVVSMWAVNDLSTAKIMMLFYENLSLGMDKSKALQQAKLDYLDVADDLAAHPAYWAPFIQIGDHHPIYIHRKGGANFWLYLLAALAVSLFVIGIIWRKRKALQ